MAQASLVQMGVILEGALVLERLHAAAVTRKREGAGGRSGWESEHELGTGQGLPGDAVLGPLVGLVPIRMSIRVGWGRGTLRFWERL